jgi:hypothetical protein
VENRCRKSFARYGIAMAISFALYAMVLVVSLNWLHAGVEGPWKYVAAVLPVLPALGIPISIMQYCRAMDELQLRIQLESLAFGFALAAIATFTYGFLQNAGMPDVSWVWVWPVMGVCWIVGILTARWRYR